MNHEQYPNPRQIEPPSGREVARDSVTEGECVLRLLIRFLHLTKAPPPVCDGSPLSEGAVKIMHEIGASSAVRSSHAPWRISLAVRQISRSQREHITFAEQIYHWSLPPSPLVPTPSSEGGTGGETPPLQPIIRSFVRRGSEAARAYHVCKANISFVSPSITSGDTSYGKGTADRRGRRSLQEQFPSHKPS